MDFWCGAYPRSDSIPKNDLQNCPLIFYRPVHPAFIVAMKLSLYNTLSKSVQEFTPIHDREVHMYSCGPTVYDHAHIGNLRSFLFPDILQRSLRIICGYRVKWVMNITDIDDKTITIQKSNCSLSITLTSCLNSCILIFFVWILQNLLQIIKNIWKLQK